MKTWIKLTGKMASCKFRNFLFETKKLQALMRNFICNIIQGCLLNIFFNFFVTIYALWTVPNNKLHWNILCMVFKCVHNLLLEIENAQNKMFFHMRFINKDLFCFFFNFILLYLIYLYLCISLHFIQNIQMKKNI